MQITYDGGTVRHAVTHYVRRPGDKRTLCGNTHPYDASALPSQVDCGRCRRMNEFATLLMEEQRAKQVLLPMVHLLDNIVTAIAVGHAKLPPDLVDRTQEILRRCHGVKTP